MIIREILAVQRVGTGDTALLEVTAWLAREFQAYVRGLCLYPAPRPTVAECFVVGDRAIGAVSRHLHDEADDATRSLEQAFRAKLAECGADGDWTRADNSDAVQSAPLHVRLVDLAILSRPEVGDHPGVALADAFLLHGGSPCLFVPTNMPVPTALDRIVLAWNGSREAKRALDDALPLLKRHAAAVQVIIAGPSAEAGAHDRIDALAVHLARHGIDADVRHHPSGRHGAVQILEACKAFDADLLVLGAYGHSRGAEAVLGGVTRDILTSAPLPVFMGR